MEIFQIKQNLHRLTLIVLIFAMRCHASLDDLYSNLYPEDAKLNFSSLASKYGHPATEYEVVTEDGYVLTLFRLPGTSRTPILLTHGLQDSSDIWLLRGNQSLAISLANRGYDVWICNFRGNRYSRRHLYLNPDLDDSYWNFSFHEFGYFDLPVFIDKVLNETKVTKLTAIGHSQGTTVYFVLGSTRTEYNSKINLMIALAPICFLQNMKYPVAIAVRIQPLLDELGVKLGLTEVLGDSNTLRKVLNIICPLPVIGYAVCELGILSMIGGYDPAELEPEFLPVVTSHFPAGSSWKSISHFLQVGHRKQFAQYDYSSEKNRQIYNSSTPPIYDLSKVTMPVILFAGRNDNLSTLKDIAILRKKLKNLVLYAIVPRPWHNHGDNTWGRHVHVYLYSQIFRLLSRYI